MNTEESIHKLLQEPSARVRSLANGAFACEVAGEHAVSCWHRLYARLSETGLYPVVIGNVTNFRSFEGRWDSRGMANLPTTNEMQPIDVPEWIENRLEEMRSDLGDESEGIEVPPRGEWPGETQRSQEFQSVMSSAGTRYLGSVGMFLLPARESWDVLPLLGFGGWNECPGPEEHSAFLRYWHQRYGALLFALTEDVLELAVARPPNTHSEAINVALEQYAYCPDIVDQGTETIEGLAAEIIEQPRWFFWWD